MQFVCEMDSQSPLHRVHIWLTHLFQVVCLLFGNLGCACFVSMDVSSGIVFECVVDWRVFRTCTVVDWCAQLVVIRSTVSQFAPKVLLCAEYVRGFCEGFVKGFHSRHHSGDSGVVSLLACLFVCLIVYLVLRAPCLCNISAQF